MKNVLFFKRILPTLILLAIFFAPLTAWSAENSRFEEGQAAFARGDYLLAYRTFLSLLQEQPGNPELDFLLGRSAYAIGDFETAVFAYERVLIADPGADRVRLELSRAFFALGDLESARAHLNQVLDHQPPEAVKKNIGRYLQRIENAALKHRFGGSLSVGLSYDSNVHSSPIEEQIQTSIGTVTLEGRAASPKEDLLNRNSLQLTHLYRRHPQASGWLSTLQLHNTSYFDEQSLNLVLFGLSTGPLWQGPKEQTKLQLHGNYLLLDNEGYLGLGGLSLEKAWMYSERIGFGVAAQISYLDYEVDERDGMQYRLEVNQSFNWARSRLLTSLGLESNQARESEHAYLRQFLGLRYERRLPWRVLMGVGARLQSSTYAGVSPLFAKERSDQLGEVSLGFSRPLWTGQAARQLLAAVNATLTKTRSNIDLYEYEKQVVNFSLSYRF